MLIKKYREELLTAFILLTTVVITIVFSALLEKNGVAVRRWNWYNLLLVLLFVPLLFLKQKASLPSVQTINEKKGGWFYTFGVGILFGLLDVLIKKIHPAPGTLQRTVSIFAAISLQPIFIQFWCIGSGAVLPYDPTYGFSADQYIPAEKKIQKRIYNCIGCHHECHRTHSIIS